MAAIPKIALQRLRRDEHFDDHPDADLVTAFLEQALTARERSEILEHLGRCHECREVVGQSLPEVLRVVPARSAVNSLTWPLLRWAGAVTCIVVVATAVMWHRESRSKPEQVIAVQSPEVASIENKAVQPEVGAVPTGEQAAKDTSHRQHFYAPMLRKKASPRKPVSAMAQEALSVTTADTQISQMQSSNALESREAAATSAPPTAIDGLVPGRAKEAEPAASANDVAPSAKQNLAALAAPSSLSARARLLPRWALTSEGNLQRSFDGGISWEKISVAPQSRLRALAANGLDIWVGGSDGALFHSGDAGQHWTQIRPIADGELLTADIIGVEFPNLQHGKITTSTMETWSTEDAGQHWRKK